MKIKIAVFCCFTVTLPTDISNTLLNATPPFASVTDPDQGTGDQIPRAYLTVAFFNERFEFISECSIAVRVSQAGDGAPSLVLSNIKAPKNGYAYIYISNENDDAVYFDNFTVSDTRGRIIEEDHYYPFGLKIAGISSTKLGDTNEGSLKNNNLYNDKELFDDADLDWYDYGFRNYDPQIGRFTQLDPLTDDYPELTNYQYASDDPIANVDIDGLEGTSSIGDFTYNLASKSKLVLGHMPQVSAALTKTVSHILPIAIQAIHLAVNVVQRQINNKSLYKIASDELSKSVMDYYLAHNHEMSFTDLLALNALANNYYKGLNCMAWWAKGDFLKLNRAVINSTLPDELKVQLVELGIEDSQEGWHSYFHTAADVTLFISSLGLFPEVGMGPKGSMLKFRTPPQIYRTVSPATQDELAPTLNRIKNGIKFAHRNDGEIFRNTEGFLPTQETGYYREYVHPTPGIRGPGARRIVVGRGGDYWFTPDHYQTFYRIK